MNVVSDRNLILNDLATPAQIDVLQNQIRQFKTLSKRYIESKIPKTLDPFTNVTNTQSEKLVHSGIILHQQPIQITQIQSVSLPQHDQTQLSQS
jgi:hypothetical protein